MKDRNKRPLFQYLEGFGGVELIQTKNEEGTEHAAWVRNRGKYRRYRMAGVRPSGKLEGV